MKLLFENWRKFINESAFSGNGPLSEPIEEVDGEVQFKSGWGKDEEGNIRRDDYDPKDHPHHSKADPHTEALKNLENYLYKNAHPKDDADLIDAFHDLNTSVQDYEDGFGGVTEKIVTKNLLTFSDMLEGDEDLDLKKLFAAASKLIVGKLQLSFP
jgi:hypothetical protein